MSMFSRFLRGLRFRKLWRGLRGVLGDTLMDAAFDLVVRAAQAGLKGEDARKYAQRALRESFQSAASHEINFAIESAVLKWHLMDK